MKTSQIILSAALSAGLLSVSAFATTQAAHNQAVAGLKFEAPVASHVVQPVNLPRSSDGKTIHLTMTIDAAGLPHDIQVASVIDQKLSKSLITAVKQWQFTPARKNGVAVSSKVELPLELVAS